MKENSHKFDATMDYKGGLVIALGGIPLGILIASVFRFFAKLFTEDLEYSSAFDIISYGLSLLLGFFIGSLVLHVAQHNRSELFLKAVGEKSSIITGLRWHFKHYWLTEAFLIFCWTVGFLVVFVANNGICPMWLFYHAWGIPLGAIASLFYLSAIEIINIVISQRIWSIRARMTNK